MPELIKEYYTDDVMKEDEETDKVTEFGTSCMDEVWGSE